MRKASFPNLDAWFPYKRGSKDSCLSPAWKSPCTRGRRWLYRSRQTQHPPTPATYLLWICSLSCPLGFLGVPYPSFFPHPHLPCPPHLGLCPSPVFSQAAKLPMSIIIVGVGQAEFDGESSVPFPAVLSYKTPWHPVPTQRCSCPDMHAVWVDSCALRGCVSTHAGLSLILRLGSPSQTRNRGFSCMLVLVSTCF